MLKGQLSADLDLASRVSDVRLRLVEGQQTVIDHCAELGLSGTIVTEQSPGRVIERLRCQSLSRIRLWRPDETCSTDRCILYIYSHTILLLILELIIQY